MELKIRCIVRSDLSGKKEFYAWTRWGAEKKYQQEIIDYLALRGHEYYCSKSRRKRIKELIAKSIDYRNEMGFYLQYGVREIVL